uniref:Uncharacterized protein n=1 Tax=Kuenenia stuttgartiensis TaxID=174633 RepID=Q1Q2Y7_KUEST|nr:unknown protein [Candidatus Kuenenia stuttgartiensis]
MIQYLCLNAEEPDFLTTLEMLDINAWHPSLSLETNLYPQISRAP